MPHVAPFFQGITLTVAVPLAKYACAPAGSTHMIFF